VAPLSRGVTINGEFHSGTARNVIARPPVLKGSVRTWSPACRRRSGAVRRMLDG